MYRKLDHHISEHGNQWTLEKNGHREQTYIFNKKIIFEITICMDEGQWYINICKQSYFKDK